MFRSCVLENSGNAPPNDFDYDLEKNMSRHLGCAKETTDRYHAFDVRQLHRTNHLVPEHGFTLSGADYGSQHSSLDVHVERDRMSFVWRRKCGADIFQRFEIMLEHTPCFFGGCRTWFLCPTPRCGRRVAVLYLGGTGIFACRHCLKLSYASQLEGLRFRSLKKWARNR